MSVLGLALGVAVLIVVLSVLNGFETELRSRMLAVTSHATITGLDGEIPDWRARQATAARVPGVKAAVPYHRSARPVREWPASRGRHGARRVAGRRGARPSGSGARLKSGALADLRAGQVTASFSAPHSPRNSV